MSEKLVIITGATSGLGLETSKKILKHSKDFHIIIPCRNMEKGESVKKQIIDYSGNKNIDLIYMDLNSLSTIRLLLKMLKSLTNPYML